MKKVLYISNIEVPYRSEFFNQLSKEVDLTVLYERRKSSNRDENWSKSVPINYKIKYLKGIKIKNEYSVDLSIVKHVLFGKYDEIVFGCFNSISQIIATRIMLLLGKKYMMNIDGEYYLEGKQIKQIIKRHLIKGAKLYLVAGKIPAAKLEKYIDKDKIVSYLFSSLTEKEILYNKENKNINNNNYVLVVGQYFDYKGIDNAIECAKLSPKINYKFIGSGNRSDILKKKIQENAVTNIEVIPFLEKEQLYEEYKNCKMLLLPSNKECWGLVVNEAASFGCPIISTLGSGAAIEFLNDSYSELLSKESSGKSIFKTLNNLYYADEDYIIKYKKFLIEKSQEYTIENNVKTYANIINR